MSLKVGDKRRWKNGCDFVIVYTAKEESAWEREDGRLFSSYNREIVERSTPYTEPAPAKKIVAHTNLNDEVLFCIEGSARHREREASSLYTRIPLTPEMFGGGE